VQPSYWDKCRKSDFGQLRQFIDDSLQDLSLQDGDDRPRSKEEFQGLLEMLRKKISASSLPKISPDPGDPPPLPKYTISKQLQQQFQSLHAQRKQLKVQLSFVHSELQRKQGRKRRTATERKMLKKQTEELRAKLRSIEHAITSLKDRERQEHEERRNASPSFRAYKAAKAAHLRSVQQREEQLRIASGRLKIIERISADVERAFKYGTTKPMRRLPWHVLPPGELSATTLHQHYHRLQQQNPCVRYEIERINKAFSLHPDQCYVGRDEFEGYIILTFAHTPKALLECPVFGNAIYIINSDWKRLSSKTKQELLTNHSGEITKIVHKGDWFTRVKRRLGFR
jgi:hypothetical protein